MQSSDNSQLNEIDLMQMTVAKFGGVSTKMKDLVRNHTTTPHQFDLIDYQLTTQTVVLEITGIVFNDFRIDVDKFAAGLRKLRTQWSDLGGLLSISSKRFDLLIDQSEDACTRDDLGVSATSSVVSRQHQMNSSIEFQYMQLTKSKAQPKIYKLRMFRNGMLQIPGVVDCWSLSDVQFSVTALLQMYTSLFECMGDVTCATRQIAMANYTTRFPIAENQRIDLVRAHVDNQRTPAFIQLCAENGLQCIQFEVAVRRVVMYVKFLIDKQRDVFTQYNAASTSNRRAFKAITLQITQRGIVIIQGSTGQFNVLYEILTKFQKVANIFFPQYLRTDTGNVPVRRHR